MFQKVLNVVALCVLDCQNCARNSSIKIERNESELSLSSLMAGLPHDGVDDVEPRDLELGAALLDELLDGLDDVLVELDGLDRRLGDGRHARLRDRRLQLVQRRQLLVERLHRLHLDRGPFSPPSRPRSITLLSSASTF